MSHHNIHNYSQNKTVNEKIVKNLIDRSSINRGDLVYDIGAGTGNITGALLEKGARVIAIEKDEYLYRKLQLAYGNREAVSLHHADFLRWEFSPGHKYKVFANIPFIQTADIVKKLLFSPQPPEDCYLVIQKEAALKYTGLPKETLVSLMIKPEFWVSIVHHFDRRDFFPVPAVDIVLMQFEKRKCRLVAEPLYLLYRDFIVYCREMAAGSVKSVLKKFFNYAQVKHISGILELDLRQNPAGLNFMQYLGIFQYLVNENPRNIKLIHGAEDKWAHQRAGLVKLYRTYRKRSLPP